MKKNYGVFNSSIPVKYGIGIFDSDSINKVLWVTKVNFGDKSFEFKKGEKAYFFDSYEMAAEVATSMNCHCYPAFVISVPELSENYFDNFVNEEE